jgi:hypothetical protein
MERTTELVFEVGDRVYCPYYGHDGFITDISANPNAESLDMVIPDIITVQYGDDPKECIYTKVRTMSANSPSAVYLQMVCKKDDINWEYIGKKGRK